MGNHASSGERRDRHKSGDQSHLISPGRIDGQAFTFDKPKAQKVLQQQHSEEEHEPVTIKALKSGNEGKENEDPVPIRHHRPIMTAGNKKMLPFVIKWSGGGSKVAIAGTFNQWQQIPMVKSEKDFVAIVDLPEGHHEYKFFVDGDWKVSNDEAACDNNMGTQNNVITIKERDFEEFENALLRDPNDKEKADKSKADKDKDKDEDKKEEFSQEIPEYQHWEKIKGPPVLPPHLLQVILNKDTPISCEPTLLPEPNHVMLNHMYALSIRDGMMVLSTSHRYRKKCVTTLIYRPIE